MRGYLVPVLNIAVVEDLAARLAGSLGANAVAVRNAKVKAIMGARSFIFFLGYFLQVYLEMYTV
jgi:hypothetical protein